jgi:hypothetical protein
MSSVGFNVMTVEFSAMCLTNMALADIAGAPFAIMPAKAAVSRRTVAANTQQLCRIIVHYPEITKRDGIANHNYITT